MNSVWLNNLIDIKRGVGAEVGWWLDDNLGREVGDGTTNLFWWDPWNDGMILKRNFSRHFDLVDNKMTTVAKMYSLEWGGGEGGEAWKWRRQLFSWEEKQLRECCVILSNIVLQPNSPNTWFWHLQASNNYNVTSAYNYMFSSVNIMEADHSNNIWNKEVPLKVNFFVWHLLRKRLLTTEHLIKRHVLHPNAQLCMGGCGLMEDVGNHFLSCDFFLKIWLGISHSLGFSTVQPAHVVDHFNQFEYLGGFSKNIHATFQLIWLTTMWVI